MKQAKSYPLRLLMAVLALALVFGCAAVQAEDACKVYFNYNYQGAPAADAQTVAAGKPLSKPADPVREGYRFTGWYTNTVCNKAYDFSAPVTENMRLFAGWTPTHITVTFSLNGGGDDARQTVAVGEAISPIADPAREGYEFQGWYSNAAATRPFDFSAPAGTSNITVYAGWLQEQAAITYVLYGDETLVEKADFGAPLTRPADPAREDYAFDDWYTAVAGAEKYDFSAPVTADARIYAHWIQTVASVTFDGNYEGAESEVVKVDIGSAVADAPAPERTGYDFTAWYADAAATQAFDLTAPIGEDTTLFAGWALREYTVTFSANYEGGAETPVQVLFGETVTAPADPARSGFDFSGWFLDAACTQLFNAADPVSGDLTVYAGWQSQAEATGDRIYTYMLNYGDQGVYETQSYPSTRRVKAPAAPSRPGYYFAGWARNPDGSNLYDFSSERSTRSTTLYAKWLKGYRFEAEYTFVDGKPGQGSSDNCMGKDIIQGLKDVLGNGHLMGMSNGYYVGKLYYNGAFIVFEITAEEEITDGVLVVRLTPDLFDMYFTDETWQVIVNGERIEYGKLNLTGAIAQTDFDELGNAINGDMNKRPFENYVMTTALHLNVGNNIIQLVTNNKEDHGGTFNAETPLVDCIFVYGNTDLKWTSCYPENVNQTMDDVSYDVTFDTGA